MKTIGVIALLALLSGCTSSQVIRDSVYKYSEAAFKSSNPEKALSEYPKKEKGGYIPAEHEVVLLYMISSMYYMRNNDWAKARVEVKSASYFLENFFQAGQKHFDDPALRLMLAALWSALGEWNEAQVDLRRAYELCKDKNLLPLLKELNLPVEEILR